jgi:hypothetical protein
MLFSGIKIKTTKFSAYAIITVQNVYFFRIINFFEKINIVKCKIIVHNVHTITVARFFFFIFESFKFYNIDMRVLK